MSCAPAWPRTRMNDLIAKPAGVLQVASERRLTAAEFQGLAEVGVWGATEQKVHLSPASARKPLCRLVSPGKPSFFRTWAGA